MIGLWDKLAAFAHQKEMESEWRAYRVDAQDEYHTADILGDEGKRAAAQQKLDSIARAMKQAGILLVCFLFCLNCKSANIQEQRIDLLLLIIFEVALFTQVLWMFQNLGFFLMVFALSIFCLLWNALFVQWALIGYINIGILVGAFFLALCGVHKL